jgi:hypothetical protein
MQSVATKDRAVRPAPHVVSPLLAVGERNRRGRVLFRFAFLSDVETTKIIYYRLIVSDGNSIFVHGFVVKLNSRQSAAIRRNKRMRPTRLVHC